VTVGHDNGMWGSAMEHFDVIVIGGGLAGLCAAVEAGERGAGVLLLEKREEPGGSTVLSAGYMAFAGTDMQQAAGIEDSAEKLAEDLIEVGGGVNDRQLVEAYGRHQLETYYWLKAKGVEFRGLHAASGHSVPRGHTVDPRQAVQTLYERIRELPNVEARFRSPARRLVRSGSGRVDQVLYETGGGQRTASAAKGILIASGGFSQSGELVNHFAPHLKKALRIGGAGNHGDGLRMAWEHGAWVRDLPYLNGTYGLHPSASGAFLPMGMAYYKGAIIVNKLGKRFVNESISYKLLGNAALRQPDAVTFQIWDQTVMDQSSSGDDLYDFELLKRRGLVYVTDTLDELADRIDVPKETLKETIRRYNENVKRGVDPDFGRITLSHRYGKPTPIEKPPFYAFESAVGLLATYAGIAVNALAQAVNPFGEPIPGLYAAGEVTGGFHGAAYMTGSSLGKASVFSRIAVRTMLDG